MAMQDLSMAMPPARPSVRPPVHPSIHLSVRPLGPLGSLGPFGLIGAHWVYLNPLSPFGPIWLGYIIPYIILDSSCIIPAMNTLISPWTCPRIY